jgi:hypothetical protein
MKKNSTFLILCFIALTFGANAQLKVNSSGKVGIGLDPDATYNLSLTSAIFKAGGGYPDLIAGPNPGGTQARAIYPTVTNNGMLGASTNVFSSVYATTHYGTLVALGSDKRLKENFRTIEKPLDKILQISGQKYDFISNRTDSFKSENEKKRETRIEKDRLGFIAQDLQKILPEAVFYFEDEDRYYIEYNALIPVIVEAMKEQQAQIEELKSIIANYCETNLKSAALITSTTETMIEDVARLDQNIPNPFNKETRIGCVIPKGSTSSFLYVYNMNGAQLQQYNIAGTGQQTITISGNSLEPGMYLYALVVDGKEVDTKRMILTK